MLKNEGKFKMLYELHERPFNRPVVFLASKGFSLMKNAPLKERIAALYTMHNLDFGEVYMYLPYLVVDLSGAQIQVWIHLTSMVLFTKYAKIILLYNISAAGELDYF